MSYRISFTVYDFPGSIDSRVSELANALESRGWSVGGYGIGDTTGIFPRNVDGWIRVGRATATQAETEEAVKSLAGGGIATAWSNFASSAVNDVVVPTVQQTGTAIADAGKAAGSVAGSLGFGLGAGTIVGLAVVGVGLLLYVKYGSRLV